MKLSNFMGGDSKIDPSIDAWFSSHGRLQGGNDNKNVRNLHVKEIACLYMCTCIIPPPPHGACFCPNVSGCVKVLALSSVTHISSNQLPLLNLVKGSGACNTSMIVSQLVPGGPSN